MISLEFEGIEILDRQSLCAAVEENMPFLRQRASRFFSWSPAADQDDLVQEAAIGFWGALSSYDPEKAVPFGLYASRCVDNRLKSFSRSQRRKKRLPAGGVVPLSEEALDCAFPAPCEAARDPEELVKTFHLAELAAFFQANGAECLLLGCTHFPWFRQALAARTALPLLDPADWMYQRLRQGAGR